MARPRFRSSLTLLSFAMSSGLAGSALAQDALDQAVQNDLTLDRVVNNLNNVIAAEFLPDGRMLIIQLTGEVLLWDGAATSNAGSINVQVGSERGLLGVAIDPMFSVTNRVYFYYSTGGAQSVGWTTLDPMTGQLDIASLGNNTLISGMAANRNHNGGGIQFGPDGHLYVGVGDTGCNCGCSPGTNQDNYFPTCLTRYHGKILRVDRDGNVPATNPLVGVNNVPACGGTNASCFSSAPVFPSNTGAPLTEIYNWGFRNPWRFSFDSQTGYMWIGDVGEVTFEEITVSTGPGEHHGWPFREGLEGQARTTCTDVVPQSAGACKEPAFAYSHNEAPGAGQASVTGGVFSNHCSWPAGWSGRYWFGDFNKTRIWSLTPNQARDGVVDNSREIIVRSAGGPVHFFNGPDGAIYYVTINDGEIWRIGPANPAACPKVDAGGPDMGGPAPDMGGPAPDMGEPDLGVADTGDAPDVRPGTEMGVLPDTGPTADMGQGPADTGVNLDLGSTIDAGDGGDEDDGCGCTSTHGKRSFAFMGLFLLALITLRPRRK